MFNVKEKSKSSANRDFPIASLPLISNFKDKTNDLCGRACKKSKRSDIRSVMNCIFVHKYTKNFIFLRLKCTYHHPFENECTIMMKRRKYGAQLRHVIYHWRHTVEAHAHNWKAAVAASSLSRSRPRFLPSEGKENEAGQPNKRFQMSSKCAFGRFMRIATFMFIISLRAANCNLTVIFFKQKRRTTLGHTVVENH